MIIAREKKKTNIVEYLVYMFQIENSIRALNFDERQIEEQLVNKYEQTEEVKVEIRNWYLDLSRMMIEEKIKEKGHLQFLRNILNDLYGVHIMLLKGGEDNSYENTYYQARPDLELLHKKIGNPVAHDVETGVEGIYGYLLLQINNKETTVETRAAITRITEWLYLLATRYRQFEAGEREI
ncbi:MAG: DUF4924 family protein [Chlorobi bacterium]|nr:DUF4924 family protein [Chlorobiota bacterium]